jgi:hypothetical protein
VLSEVEFSLKILLLGEYANIGGMGECVQDTYPGTVSFYTLCPQAESHEIKLFVTGHWLK